MNNAEIKKSLAGKRVYLSTTELLRHWINGVFIFFFWVTIILANIQAGWSNGRISLPVIVLTAVAVLLFRHKLNSRKFDIWELTVSEEQFKNASLATAKYLGWHMINNTQNYTKAIKNTGWQWDGIRITAIRTKNNIYINSMIEPSLGSNPFSFGWNAKNKNEFRKQLLLAISGEDVVEQATRYQEERELRFWQEKEFSGKNLLKRLIIYPLILLFTGLGIWMLLEGTGLKSILIPALLFLICGTYLYADFAIIREKRRRKNPEQ